MSSLASIDPFYLNVMHTFLISALALMVGIAVSMSLWIIPIIHLAPDSATKIKQFTHNITLGGRYQQPMSRIIPALVLSLTFLSYSHNDPQIQQRWKYYIAAMAIMIPIGPWEVYLVFPMNEKLKLWGDKLAKDRKDMFGDEKDAEVDVLLEKWRKWHGGRIAMPFTSFVILVWCAFAS